MANELIKLAIIIAAIAAFAALGIILILGKEIKEEMKPDRDIRTGFNDSGIHETW